MERSEPTNLLDRPSFTIGQPSPFDTSDAEENSNLEAPLPSDDAQLLIGEESGEASSNKEESPPSQSDSRDENSGKSIFISVLNYLPFNLAHDFLY